MNILVLNTICNARVTNIVVLPRYFYICSAILTTKDIIIRSKNFYGYLITPSEIKRRPTQVFVQSGQRFFFGRYEPNLD